MQHQKLDLLFNENELKVLQERIKQGKRSELHLRLSTGHCEQMVDPSSKNYFDYKELKSSYWNDSQGPYVIPARLLSLALVGKISNRDDFCHYAKDAISHLININFFDDFGMTKAHPKFNQSSPDHNSGKFYMMLAIIFDLLHDEFTSEDRDKLVAKANACLENIEPCMPVLSLNIDNNRGLKSLLGIGVLARMVSQQGCGNQEKANIYLNFFSSWFESGLKTNFGYDGAPFEGASYGTSMNSFANLIAHIMSRSGKKNFKNDVRFKRIADYVIQETVYSKGWVNNINDCNLRDASFECVYYAGVEYQRPAALWHWDKFNLNNPSSPLSIANPDYIPNDFWQIPWVLLWPDDQAVEASPPSHLTYPNSKWFRDRGLVSCRNGWDSDSLHITMKSGREERLNHQNADQNQVTFYSHGELFLIDSGYVIKPRPVPTIDGRRPEAHNVIFIDDIGQTTKLGKEGASRGRITDFKTDPDYSYVLGDASEAYGDIGVLNKCERHLQTYWGKSLPNHTVWLDDVNYDDNEHEYTILLHTEKDNSFKWENNQIFIQGKKHVLDIHLQSTAKLSISETTFDDHPCLQIKQRGTRVQFAMLLHPRTIEEVSLTCKIELSENSADFTLNDQHAKIEHHLDLSQAAEIYTGEYISRSTPPIITKSI